MRFKHYEEQRSKKIQIVLKERAFIMDENEMNNNMDD